jgi:hypothetical protein
MRVVEKIELNCSATDAWAVIGDYGNDVQWRGEVVGVTSQPSGQVQAGTEVLEVAKFMGMKLKTPGKVVGAAGRSFRWQTGGGLQFTGQRRVDETSPGRSRVTLIVEGHFSGALLPLRVVEPLIQSIMRRQVTKNLAQLRVLLGAAAAHPRMS